MVLGHIKLLSTELFLKKNPFFTQFLAKFHSNYFKLLFLHIFFIFLQLKKKSNSLVTVWYALRLSQQPTVSLNYSQSIKINMAPSDGGIIISSSNLPTVIYLRLTDFWLAQLFKRPPGYENKIQWHYVFPHRASALE